MKCIFLNVNKKLPPEQVEIDDDLQTYYDLIGCEHIAIVRRKIGKKYYQIICDDDIFLNNPDPKVSAISPDGYIRLLGNLIICADRVYDGQINGLTQTDMKYIKNHIVFVCANNKPCNGYYMLMQCDF